ncbi:MAG: shikimate dehydrogenase [Alphaproteobacteria bacterium]|jgi:shikimate dehydrogenase
MILTGKAKLAGIMGWPVGHSLSPRLHNYWLDLHGIDGAFVPLPVAPEHFAHALRLLPLVGFQGVNITVPHKEAALEAIDIVEPIAHRIGAVNTVTVQADGALKGTNTDAAGFTAHLLATVPGFNAASGPCVVIGAGGAARAVAVALQDLGAGEIHIVNRTLARAEALALALGNSVRVIDWTGRVQALGDASLVVNTTTQGMIGEPPLDLGLDSLPPQTVVFDIVYNPLETPLLATARRRGNPVVDGLGMLLHQAVAGFEAWFGVRPTVDDALRVHVLGPLLGRALDRPQGADTP